MHDTSSNDLSLIVAQAIEEIKSEQGLEFSKEKRPKRRSTLQNLNDEPESPGGSSDGSRPTASRTRRMG